MEVDEGREVEGRRKGGGFIGRTCTYMRGEKDQTTPYSQRTRRGVAKQGGACAVVVDERGRETKESKGKLREGN